MTQVTTTATTATQEKKWNSDISLDLLGKLTMSEIRYALRRKVNDSYIPNTGTSGQTQFHRTTRQALHTLELLE